MKKTFLTLSLLIILILTGCSNTTTDYSEPIQTNHYDNTNDYSNTESIVYETAPKYTNYVTVKYRDTQVDIANFKTFDTSNSSLVRWTWYDENNQYMIIDLNWVKYHYCRFPSFVWNNFKSADSFGKYYTSNIKWNYDCRNWWIPIY